MPSWTASLLVVAVVLVAVGLWSWLGPRPSNARNWQPEHSVLPEFTLDGSLLTVRGVRNFSWRSASDFEPAWEEREYPVDELRGVWYVLTPFSKSWRGPAHSLLSFQFGDDTFLAISVEARRQVGESYSLLKGMARRFELIYVAGDERDLIGVRAIHRGDQVYVYPVDVSLEGARALLMSMADSANALRERPEFYHTITNNCTTRIVDHVNLVAPGRVPRSWKVILPGYSDGLAYGLGLLDTPLSLDDARARWHVNERAIHAGESPDFSLRIRAPEATLPAPARLD